jgi:hypothetical protein
MGSNALDALDAAELIDRWIAAHKVEIHTDEPTAPTACYRHGSLDHRFEIVKLNSRPHY